MYVNIKYFELFYVYSLRLFYLTFMTVEIFVRGSREGWGKLKLPLEISNK